MSSLPLSVRRRAASLPRSRLSAARGGARRMAGGTTVQRAAHRRIATMPANRSRFVSSFESKTAARPERRGRDAGTATRSRPSVDGRPAAGAGSRARPVGRGVWPAGRDPCDSEKLEPAALAPGTRPPAAPGLGGPGTAFGQADPGPAGSESKGRFGGADPPSGSAASESSALRLQD